MTPQGHYTEAERLLDEAKHRENDDPSLPFLIGEAQVHATLATVVPPIRMIQGFPS